MNKGEKMATICGDNRDESIRKAKEALLESTNIEDSPKEMAVLDNFLFRCWQMGWLDKYNKYDNYKIPWVEPIERAKHYCNIERKPCEYANSNGYCMISACTKVCGYPG